MRKSWLVCALLGTLAWGQAAPSAPSPAQPPQAPADTSASVASDAAVIVEARTEDVPATTNSTNTLLAERRLAAGALPTTIVLDDSLAINASDTLSAHQQVEVEARIVSTAGGPDLSGRSDARGLENRRASVVIAASSP